VNLLTYFFFKIHVLIMYLVNLLNFEFFDCKVLSLVHFFSFFCGKKEKGDREIEGEG